MNKVVSFRFALKIRENSAELGESVVRCFPNPYSSPKNIIPLSFVIYWRNMELSKNFKLQNLLYFITIKVILNLHKK
jgi:hypothetical protein